MRLLLDTHVFLWYVAGDPLLPAAFRAAIQDPANEAYLSVALLVWEAVIKYGLGKTAAACAAGDILAPPVRPALHRKPLDR